MPVSLICKLKDAPVAFVDVETTGASALYGDRVIELGIVRIENGTVAAEFQQLLDPQRRIAPGVAALTGITQDMVAGQPSFCDVVPQLRELLSDAVVIGHNVLFDLSFLHSELARARCDIVEQLVRAHVLDTLRLARRRFGRHGNALQNLARRFNLQSATAHRALADARTAQRLFELLMEPIGGWGAQIVDAIAAQGGPVRLRASASEALLPLELAEALEAGAVVRMEYLDAKQQQTQREVRPLRLRRLKGEMILLAHCALRNEVRHFKLERIVRLSAPEKQMGAQAPQLFSSLGVRSNEAGRNP